MAHADSGTTHLRRAEHSGAGQQGCDELSEQTIDIFNQRLIKPSTFQGQIAFNCLPQIGTIGESDYSTEELRSTMTSSCSLCGNGMADLVPG